MFPKARLFVYKTYFLKNQKEEWIPYYPLKDEHLLEILRRYLLEHSRLDWLQSIEFDPEAQREIPKMIRKQGGTRFQGRGPERFANEQLFDKLLLLKSRQNHKELALLFSVMDNQISIQSLRASPLNDEL